MNIIISRDERTFGPYSREQAKQFLESGELLSSDLASWEGNEEWVPLESLLSSSNNPEQTDDFEEEDPLDDFDHEKMKQWEDVFVDDEDEEEAASESNQFIDDGFPDDETSVSKPEEPVASAPPPISEVPAIPEVPAVQDEQADESLPAVAEASVPEVEQEETFEDLAPPPPPPAPSSRGSKSKKTSPAKEEPEAASQLTPRSKKIKGLNSRQTVIVVKGESILSKIYTTSLIFLILLVITCLIAVGGLFFSYGSVAPVLKDMGVPSGIIEAFKSQDENSRMDRAQNECVLSSVSRLESEKEIIDSRGG
jgi:hypothetical protein